MSKLPQAWLDNQKLVSVTSDNAAVSRLTQSGTARLTEAGTTRVLEDLVVTPRPRASWS